MGFGERRNKTRFNGKRKFRGNPLTARSKKSFDEIQLFSY